MQDPPDLAPYENKLRYAIEGAKAIVVEAIESYDGRIRQIEVSKGWCN